MPATRVYANSDVERTETRDVKMGTTNVARVEWIVILTRSDICCVPGSACEDHHWHVSNPVEQLSVFSVRGTQWAKSIVNLQRTRLKKVVC